MKRCHPNPVTGAPGAGSRAYTLVEAMVTVALVTMMMGILASVFTNATGTLDVYRSRSEMDQKVRGVRTVIASDLKRMHIEDDEGWPPQPPVTGGYLTYGEGELADATTHADVDDWIQWTAHNPEGEVGAVEVSGQVDNDTTNFPRNTRDDGLARSPYYEVAYFLRPDRFHRREEPAGSGTYVHDRYILYRRIYLVGERLQPRTGDSALHDIRSDVSPWLMADLDRRRRRWGFWWHGPTPSIFDTQVVYNNSTAGDYTDERPWASPFLDSQGFRPSLRQTSCIAGAGSRPAWPSPGSTTTPPLLTNPSGTSFTWDPWSTAVSWSPPPGEYIYGERTGYDILARNVLSFDVKFWDRYADPDGRTASPRGAFVDIGEVVTGGAAVDYPTRSLAREWRSDGAYWNPIDGNGAREMRRVYDTWSTDYNYGTHGEQPPYAFHDDGSANGSHQPRYYDDDPSNAPAATDALPAEWLTRTQFPRAVQIRIRFADPYGTEGEPAREVTIVVDLTKR